MADSRKRQQGGSKRPAGRGGDGSRPRGGSYGKKGQGRPTGPTAAPAKGGKGGSRPERGPVAQVPSGSFIEGRRAAAEALRSGFPIKRALVAEGSGHDAALSRLLGDLTAARIPYTAVPRAQLDAISSHGAHQGIVLEAAPFPYADLSDVIARAGEGPALVVVLDHVTDAGNFGAIVRTAEVVGAAGVVIANRRAAEVTVATYKTSAGAVMHLPIAQVPNIARALEELKDAGFWACAATEHADQACWDAPLAGRIALVMGSEGEGISRLVLERCDILTKLPQRGETESLNVAQAATALSFEWLRQNRESLLAGARE